MYDLATGGRRARLDGQHYRAYSPDGGTLATSPLVARTLSLWDAAGKPVRATRDLAGGSAAQLLFAPDGRTFVAGDAIVQGARPHGPSASAEPTRRARR